jgi:hypothetical protein
MPPEKPLRASLLQMLYSIRGERLLMEQLGYNLLFRWFVGLHIDDRAWDHSTFSKNRDRLIDSYVAGMSLERVVAYARKTLGADKGYGARRTAEDLQDCGIPCGRARARTLAFDFVAA